MLPEVHILLKAERIQHLFLDPAGPTFGAVHQDPLCMGDGGWPLRADFPNIRMPRKPSPLRRTQPSADFNLIAFKDLVFVVDLVAAADPDDVVVQCRWRHRKPVRHRCVLHPTHINGVVHMTQLIDFFGKGDSLGEHRGFERCSTEQARIWL